jgi:hypothetical protein
MLAVVVRVLQWSSWPYSFFAGKQLWGSEAGSVEWWLNFMKHMFITLMATVPILVIQMLTLGGDRLKWFGVFINFTLMINILWRILPFETKAQNDVTKINGIMAVFLVIAQAIRVVALSIRKMAQIGLDESGVLLIHSTTLPWLVSYTAWNVVFTTYWGGFEVSFQDIYFWFVMVILHHKAHAKHSLESYFISARALSLGFYVAAGTWSYLVPSLEDCPAQPAWNQHDFAVFLCYLNILFICIVMACEVYFIFCSRGKQSQAVRATDVNLPTYLPIKEPDFEPEA